MFEQNTDPYAESTRTTRRAFLIAGTTAAAGAALWALHASSPVVEAKSAQPVGGDVTIIEFTDAGVRKGKIKRARVVKTDEEWKKQLTGGSFEVARHADTEIPFTGALLKVHDKGVFRCICCDTALFSSETKFDSGTGWPSFWAPIAKENVTEITDRTLGMERTAVSCTLCDAHLGHVFNDGPAPTGLRYCMNSVSMRFAKAV
jgi:peptide-methionine (R)-S-oxide reductase